MVDLVCGGVAAGQGDGARAVDGEQCAEGGDAQPGCPAEVCRCRLLGLRRSESENVTSFIDDLARVWRSPHASDSPEETVTDSSDIFMRL
ncbi:hypothetical protein ACGFZJ_10940 [Streptomyces sp. NPDC048253]|uniref:hypothetical protein n=1 Tax=Streptomyces sp. NPDC048253 TaxID=3365524 RepID=UPI00371AF3FF